MAITSRSLDDLKPEAKRRAQLFLSELKAADIDFLVICTYRDADAQNLLYAQGRTAAGHIVTKAKGGDSFHQYRVAFDGVPLVQGKPLWMVFNKDATLHPIWKKVAEIAESVGLEWAGRWSAFKEYDHFQYTGGLTLSDFKSGKELA
jgi:peptidoglycan LD-endopeptidase CwlK